MRKIHLKKRRFKWRLLIIPIFGFMLYGFMHYIKVNVTLTNSNDQFIKHMLQISNTHLNYEKEDTILVNLMDSLTNYEVEKPLTVLETNFAYVNTEEVKPVFGYIENSVIDSPRVYIYSTHPTESYAGSGIDGYGTKADVIMASYLLQDRLNSLGIPTVVEEKSAKDYIEKNNLSYDESYVATREFVKDALNRYPQLDLIIDLHRDGGIPKATTTTSIGGKDYARVMFVMKNTLPNIDKAREISNLTNSLYPNLSRGIYDKRNSKFNQDLNTNMILLELGSEQNTQEEVLNTIEVFANVLKEYLNER